MIAFIVGDLVEWTSQAAGHSKTKRGKVVAIVPKGVSPDSGFLEKRGLFKYSLQFDGWGRNHVAYLVLVGTKLYYPRINHLRPQGDTSC